MLLSFIERRFAGSFLVVVMVIALIMAVASVVSAKIQLDNYADELVREAEISGRSGLETTARAQVLTERTRIKLALFGH